MGRKTGLRLKPSVRLLMVAGIAALLTMWVVQLSNHIQAPVATSGDRARDAAADYGRIRGRGSGSGTHTDVASTELTGAAAPELPHYDLVIAVLVKGGKSEEDLGEIERVHRVYDRYKGTITPDPVPPGHAGDTPWTYRVVFVVDNVHALAPVPETGLLAGDFFYVNVRAGYDHLSDKTLALMALSDHISFRFLAKTDGDSFPCLRRVASKLMGVEPAEQPLVYAGLLATCGKVFPKGHKLHDPEFIKATGGVLQCHPMYHQGAFYVLGRGIVEYLHRNRAMLQLMSVEDAMVGLWLLGLKKVVLNIGGQFYCMCHTHPVPQKEYNKQSFYHFCKTDEKMNTCIEKFGAC